MDKIKFLKALKLLHEMNKKEPANDYNNGYTKALYDVMQVVDLCEELSTNKLQNLNKNLL